MPSPQGKPMKVIIDLIEDIRESIANTEAYALYAGLLREDIHDTEKLHYAGEAPIGSYVLDNEKRELLFSVDHTDAKVSIGALLPSLLILDMQGMMYPLKMTVNRQYTGMEIVGFGKNEAERHYILFIKIS